jgi:hypothetical protein
MSTERRMPARRAVLPQDARKHTLTPIRSLSAVAASGAHVYMTKYSESDRELSWGCGNVTAAEHGVFWRAKLAAERPGVEMWEKAIGILKQSGWKVSD